MSAGTAVLWLSDELESAERSSISDQPGPAALVGTAVLPYRDLPADITYSVDAADDWLTVAVSIELRAVEHTMLTLHRVDDRWSVNGEPRPDLDGCTTVDLGWSPATNTLALRGAPIAVGETQQTTAAWVRFPELDVVPAAQTYTRVGDDLVRYQSATFTAGLRVTPDDIVTRYADDLWRAVRLARFEY